MDTIAKPHHGTVYIHPFLGVERSFQTAAADATVTMNAIKAKNHSVSKMAYSMENESHSQQH